MVNKLKNLKRRKEEKEEKQIQMMVLGVLCRMLHNFHFQPRLEDVSDLKIECVGLSVI